MAEGGAGPGLHARRTAVNIGRTYLCPGCPRRARGVPAVLGTDCRQNRCAYLPPLLYGAYGRPHPIPGAGATQGAWFARRTLSAERQVCRVVCLAGEGVSVGKRNLIKGRGV